MLSAGPGPSTNRRRLRLLAIVLAAATLLLAGCGSDESGDGTDPGSDGPRVADPRFDGRFDIVELTGPGGATDLRQAPSLTIDAEFGGLEVNPGCNTYLGSFTLAEDGRASFTVTGGTRADCGDLAAQETAVLDALDAATTWVEAPDGFVFDGPDLALRVVGPAR